MALLLTILLSIGVPCLLAYVALHDEAFEWYLRVMKFIFLLGVLFIVVIIVRELYTWIESII